MTSGPLRSGSASGGEDARAARDGAATRGSGRSTPAGERVGAGVSEWPEGAKWSAVCSALDALQERQRAARTELRELHDVTRSRQRAAAALEARREEEIAALRASRAASEVQLQRQCRQLASHAALARRRSARAASLCDRARTTARHARSATRAVRGELGGALSRMAAQDAENSMLRKRLVELEKSVRERSRALSTVRDLASRQEALLDEVSVMVHAH